MTAYSRAGFKWNVNEILSLQREIELLGLDIDQIATKHKRSPDAIMYKLDQEGFADYNILYSNYNDLNSTGKPSLTLDTCCDQSECCRLNDDEECFIQCENEDEYEDDDDSDEDYVEEECDDEDDEEYQHDEDEDEDEEKVANLSERVEGLEGSIFEIRDMIKHMMSSFFRQKTDCASSSCM
jgi:TATA-binding protein-associated factor Taf7